MVASHLAAPGHGQLHDLHVLHGQGLHGVQGHGEGLCRHRVHHDAGGGVLFKDQGHDILQLSPAAADEHVGGGGQVPEGVGSQPRHHGNIGYAQMLFILLDEVAGLRFALNGVDLAVLSHLRHLQRDGARARAYVPAEGILRQAEFTQRHGPDLGLGHRHLGAEEIPVGAALGQNGVFRLGIFHQYESQGGEGLFRQLSGGAPDDALLGIGQVLAHGHEKVPETVVLQGTEKV